MWRRILILDDDEARLSRLELEQWNQCFIRLHSVSPLIYPATHFSSSPETSLVPVQILSHPYFRSGPNRIDRPSRVQRTSTAIKMLDTITSDLCFYASPREADWGLIANSSYGTDSTFLNSLTKRSWPFVLLIGGSSLITYEKADGGVTTSQVAHLLDHLEWQNIYISHGFTGKLIEYLVADCKIVTFLGIKGKLVAARIGNIDGNGAHIMWIFTSELEAKPTAIVKAALWTHWIKPHVRLTRRKSVFNNPTERYLSRVDNDIQKNDLSTPRKYKVETRSNIAASRESDKRGLHEKATHSELLVQSQKHRRLGKQGAILNTFELFAGAGGMGLGFLMAHSNDARYRIAFSAEVNPIYSRTLRLNHKQIATALNLKNRDLVPEEEFGTLDLRASVTLELAEQRAREIGGVQVLIGGPPCQGFSSSNRHSGYSSNPNNLMVEVYLDYVERLKPLVFLMENVQGILWTPTGAGNGDPLVVERLASRMENMGYIVFPKLLDAVWYGVPQHRNRFFLLGLHRDLGYSKQDFGEWGPFPPPTHGPGTGRPYVTVGEALGDLPIIANGHAELEMSYDSASCSSYAKSMRKGIKDGVIYDHITSCHAPYVIERYRAVPQGGNWENIRHMMTNYASHEGTHSNIYRRLHNAEPAITIGHYRKAMLIHPTQDRGLSLREAARLQSFPDWFRFVGESGDSWSKGLSHKQQQLANAVCPLMLRAIAENLLTL